MYELKYLAFVGLLQILVDLEVEIPYLMKIPGFKYYVTLG